MESWTPQLKGKVTCKLYLKLYLLVTLVVLNVIENLKRQDRYSLEVYRVA